MNRILLTGAGGFIGSHVAAEFEARDWDVRKAYRNLRPGIGGHAVAVGPIHAKTDWSHALLDRDIVVHLAGHVGGRGIAEEHYKEVNDIGTARLVEQVRDSDVRLFINVSTIAVVSAHASTVIVDDSTQPVNRSDYGRTKHAGELHAASLANGNRHSITVRPPIVYGDGAKGNWLALQRLAASGLPLPLASVNNSRSLLSIANFVDVLEHLVMLERSRVVSGTFAISDCEDVSTAEIIRLMRRRLEMSPRLFPMPPVLMRTAMRTVGLGEMAQSLLGDFQIDASRFGRVFGWKPRVSARDAILGLTTTRGVAQSSDRKVHQ